MLTSELRERIRRAYYVDHKSVRQPDATSWFLFQRPTPTKTSTVSCYNDTGRMTNGM
jgi:hypothetical protein